ncbi:M [Taro vein chlorosis virus]|uniref:Matrix protein n=1 Tax=Taro vein chlorosis virus TaxID=2749935 RepID=MATRX_TAVCV|nr:M [Taro vein chlorosis virus] [Taro vein chlorosis virus]Q5GA87.1 RecName: Full=Matrix protein [Alphanucleorhabdovirus colocasiae]AAV92085.1 M [Taro vein chlorosis virus] [Taro vein chlorosis virus]
METPIIPSSSSLDRSGNSSNLLSVIPFQERTDSIIGCHFTLEIKAYHPDMMKSSEEGDVTLGSLYQGIHHIIRNKECQGLILGMDATHENKLHILALAFLCVIRKYEGKVSTYIERSKDTFSGVEQLLARIHIGDDHLGTYDPEVYQICGVEVPQGTYQLTLRTVLTPHNHTDGLSITLGIIVNSPARGMQGRSPMGVDVKRLILSFPKGTDPWTSYGEIKDKKGAVSKLKSILF